MEDSIKKGLEGGWGRGGFGWVGVVEGGLTVECSSLRSWLEIMSAGAKANLRHREEYAMPAALHG